MTPQQLITCKGVIGAQLGLNLSIKALCDMANREFDFTASNEAAAMNESSLPEFNQFGVFVPRGAIESSKSWSYVPFRLAEKDKP
jgi:hypothetical protein